MALIGTNRWNPLGESMWGIATKLAQLNHLNWIERRRLMGGMGTKSFVTESRQYPDVLENFQIPGLSISCGWSPYVFRASFTDFYQPLWVDEPEKRVIKERVLLRTCPECLSYGTHLAAHQIRGLTHCPIHLAPLTSRCQDCSALLTPFLIDNDKEGFGQCRHCHTYICKENITSPVESERRIRFVAEYEKWLSKVNEAFSDSTRYRWISGPYAFRHLAHFHKLVKGPKWVEQCVVNGSVVKMKSHHWNGSAYVPPTKHTQHIPNCSQMRYWHEEDRPRHQLLFNRIARELSFKVRMIDKQLTQSFKFLHCGYGIQNLSDGHCTPLFGKNIDAFSNGYWFWRRCLDSAFPEFKRWERARRKSTFFQSCIFYNWYHGIGQLLWFRDKKYYKPANATFVRWLSNIWLEQELQEWFCLFVGVSCRNVGDHFVCALALDQYLRDVGDGALWLIDTPRLSTNIINLSTVEPISDFRHLMQEGFRGNDSGYFESFERFNPLINRLHTTPEKLYKWEKHWREVKRRVRERESSLQYR